MQKLENQNYYGHVIQEYANDVDLLRKRRFAILFHLSSTDQNPKHQLCPTGSNSWCFGQGHWQSLLILFLIRITKLSTDIGKRMVPTFQRLSKESLLQRRSRRETQNPNESLHNLIWLSCPKIDFAGRKTVDTAVLLSLCQYSMGTSFKESLLKVLGIMPGEFLKEGARKKSLKKFSKAEVANSQAGRKRRRQLKYKTSSQEQK